MNRVLLYRMFLATLGGALLAATVDPLPEEVRAEHNPGKRSEVAIELADRSVDQARAYFAAGDVKRGDSELALIGSLANECYNSTLEAHKSKYWQRAEMKVAALHRRIHSLLEELDFEERGKAAELAAQLDEIHDKLLAGVMGK
jgi:uncharacterized protein YciU (UPF0263 family)